MYYLLLQLNLNPHACEHDANGTNSNAAFFPHSAGQVLQIPIPAGVSSGQTLSVTVPGGRQLNFTVPPGMAGRSKLQLRYDPVAGTVSPLV